MRWNTLHDFYISTEWRSFRQALIAERANPADGIVYDEWSGQPLLRDCDMILHHKIELTTANVNDYSISLNPENIMIVSPRSHNEIHQRFGFAVKKVYLVWGAPCAGKNDYVSKAKGRNDLVVDMDALWQAITGGEKYFKPDTLKQNVFQLRECLLEQVKRRVGKWSTAYIISTEPRQSARNRLCAALGAEQIYLPVERETALARLADDPERVPYVEQWTEYINKFFDELEV